MYECWFLPLCQLHYRLSRAGGNPVFETEVREVCEVGFGETSAQLHRRENCAVSFAIAAGVWDSSKEIDYPWIEITTLRSIVQKDRDMMMSYMKAYMEATALFSVLKPLG